MLAEYFPGKEIGMSAGEQVTKDALNSRLASVVRTIYIGMREVKALQVYLASTSDTTLTTMGFSV